MAQLVQCILVVSVTASVGNLSVHRQAATGIFALAITPGGHCTGVVSAGILQRFCWVVQAPEGCKPKHGVQRTGAAWSRCR